MKKNAVLYVGNSLYENELFYRYINRQIALSLNHIDTITHINSSKLLITLQKLLQEESNLLIITTQNTFATTSKVIATLLADKLELKSNMLIPQKTKVYEDGTFLIDYENSQLNVIKAQPMQKLPAIMLESQNIMTLHIFDLDIESIEILIEPLTKSFEIELSYSKVTHEWIKVSCKSKKHGEINHFVKSAKKLFSNKIIDSKNIFRYLIQRLKENEKTITFAESCTGGLLAANFTAQSGASNVIKGSCVVYSNSIKSQWLGVDEEVFTDHGAVSNECVSQMLDGAIDIAKADYAVAVSGVAGPSGGTEYKPVGTVVIGVAKVDSEKKTQKQIKQLHFEGDRNYIQDQAQFYALKMLLTFDKNCFL